MVKPFFLYCNRIHSPTSVNKANIEAALFLHSYALVIQVERPAD